jgi:hypothetical protein
MNELFIAVLALLLIVAVITLYGFFKGGVDKMLEQERIHNTIDATDQVEVTVFIDFFHQIKRVDSLYFNEPKHILQFKKNNRLSDPFSWSDLKKVTFKTNETILFESNPPKAFNQLQDILETADIDDQELILELTTQTNTYIMAFESPERCKNVIKTLEIWESTLF